MDRKNLLILILAAVVLFLLFSPKVSGFGVGSRQYRLRNDISDPDLVELRVIRAEEIAGLKLTYFTNTEGINLVAQTYGLNIVQK